MSKITLDNLSDNLKEYLNGLGLSEEQVLNLINENGLNEEELKTMLKDTMSINELNTNSKTVIGAINELFQSANNGKELIASAIGEPVSAEDTFSAMSSDINSLLSTFKTNMMNNGVTVEGSDRFKSLIDKIATMVEEGEGKGIQFAEGTFTITGNKSNYTVNMNLSFNPTYVFANIQNAIHISGAWSNGTVGYVSNLSKFGGDKDPIVMSNVSSESFTISVTSSDIWSNGFANGTYSWYAIGVGEEDTTLRDSLASILQEEGVSVTEEDDMASLITKVDEEFDRKNANSVLNIISATELPATGKEGQICVVTDNPTSEINVTANVDDYASDGSIYILLGTSSSLDASKGSLIELSNNNGLKLILYYNRIYQNNTRLASYYYSNNMWNELTKKYIPLFEDGSVSNTELNSKFIFSSVSIQTVNNENVIRYGDTNAGNYAYFYTESQINFSDFNTIEITTKVSPSGTYTGQLIYYGFTNNINSLGAGTIPGSQQYTASTTNYTTTKLNISSWSGIGHLTFQMNKRGYGVYTYIQSIRLY